MQVRLIQLPLWIPAIATVGLPPIACHVSPTCATVYLRQYVDEGLDVVMENLDEVIMSHINDGCQITSVVGITEQGYTREEHLDHNIRNAPKLMCHIQLVCTGLHLGVTNILAVQIAN